MIRMLFLLSICLSALTAVAQPVRTAWSGTIIHPDSVMAPPEAPSSPMPAISDFRYVSSQESPSSSGGILNLPRTNPGVALLSSALIPGSAQAANGKWGRAAIYFLTDVVSLTMHLERNASARQNERTYMAYADENWSVTAYAQWLVAYSQANGINNGWEQIAGEIAGMDPLWGNTRQEWSVLGQGFLRIIRGVEVQTPFFFDNGRVASNFSHVVQDYGSQQYYELMSKYYQFQPGWQDFHLDRINDPNHEYRYPWNNSMITDNFIEGRDRAAEFNDQYRQAGNFLRLMMVNHVISAFDGYFMVKLKNSRIETSATMTEMGNTLTMRWHF